MQNIAICDKHHGAVFEVTTKQIVVRHATDAVCACTNHFRSNELGDGTGCPRYDILDKSSQLKKLDLTDVAEKMDAVGNDITLHTMIFEPAQLKLHLAFGPPPSSQLPLQELDLSALFANGEYPPNRNSAQNEPPVGPPHVAETEKGKYAVTFRYRPVGRANRASAVYLAGTFSDWNPTGLKMSGPDKDGYFQTTQPLGAGRHEYKFVIDGEVWRPDPNNDTRAGEFHNSVIEVGKRDLTDATRGNEEIASGNRAARAAGSRSDRCRIEEAVTNRENGRIAGHASKVRRIAKCRESLT